MPRDKQLVIVFGLLLSMLAWAGTGLWNRVGIHDERIHELEKIITRLAVNLDWLVEEHKREHNRR